MALKNAPGQSGPVGHWALVMGVTEATVLAWLRRAAQKAHEINAYLLRDLPVTQVQLDEMWNFIRRNMPSKPARTVRAAN